MQISAAGVQFIKDFEKLRLHAYKDQKGIPTIGWGNTRYQNLKPVRLTDSITKEQADALFDWALLGAGGTVDTVDRAVARVHLKQGCFDTLCCLTYNIGRGAFLDSTLLKKLLVNVNEASIAGEFLKWNKVTIDGKLQVSDGLTSRRKSEAEMWTDSILQRTSS